MDSLKLCPFSGKTPTGPIQQSGGHWRIYGAGYFVERPTELLVRAAWNTRPSPDQAWLDARDAEFYDRWNAWMNP